MLLLRHVLSVCVVQIMVQSYFALPPLSPAPRANGLCLPGVWGPQLCLEAIRNERVCTAGSGREASACKMTIPLDWSKSHWGLSVKTAGDFFTCFSRKILKQPQNERGLAAQKLDYLLYWSSLRHSSKQDFWSEISVCGKQSIKNEGEFR